jgi:hypothetical protein
MHKEMVPFDWPSIVIGSCGGIEMVSHFIFFNFSGSWVGMGDN